MLQKILKWYYGFADLKKKMMLSYGLLVLIMVSTFGLYSYWSAYKSFFEETRVSMEDTASSMSIGLENSITRANDNLRYFTYNVNLRENLESVRINFMSFTKILREDVEPVFWYFIASDYTLDWIRIYCPDILRNVGDFCHVSKLVEDQEWYQEGLYNFKTIWRIEDKKIFATRTLLDAKTSSIPIGIVELELDLKKMTESIRYIDGKTSGTLLLDANDKLIFKTSYGNNRVGQQVESFIMENKPQEFVIQDSFLITGEKEISNGWKLYYFRDRTLIDRHLMEIQLSTLLMMAVSFAFVMILGNFISAILGNRILKLKEAAEELSRGNFQVELDLRYEDEVGVLSRSFDTMQKQINKMMEEMYMLGMEKRKVELTALQAKINPHFLYNCLSAIMWKAIKKGDDDIAEVTGLLAKFYRSNLNGGKALTTVENELQTIRTYLEIQKNTHEDSFDVEYILDEEGRNLKMPNFLLQPIVENSIVHGIDTLSDKERGKIIIKYQKEEAYIVFEIRNSSSCIDRNWLVEKLEKPDSGYGLYNIRERIRIYYEDKSCGMKGTVLEDGMVSFTVRLGAELKVTDLESDEGLINR